MVEARSAVAMPPRGPSPGKSSGRMRRPDAQARCLIGIAATDHCDVSNDRLNKLRGAQQHRNAAELQLAHGSLPGNMKHYFKWTGIRLLRSLKSLVRQFTISSLEIKIQRIDFLPRAHCAVAARRTHATIEKDCQLFGTAAATFAFQWMSDCK